MANKYAKFSKIKSVEQEEKQRWEKRVKECISKVTYVSKSHAMKHKISLDAKYDCNGRIYKCKTCFFYHITTK